LLPVQLPPAVGRNVVGKGSMAVAATMLRTRLLRTTERSLK
jgi:hypothetical protein